MARARLSYEAILELIAQYKAAGIIWNQEHETLKYNIAHTFEQEMENLKTDAFMDRSREENFKSVTHDVYYALPFEARHANAALKKLAKLDQTHQDVIAATELMNRWVVVIQAQAELKSLIKKGRQPNPDRKTPERTLDNTGTCPICSKNVKLDGGRLVRHGYEVLHHQFHGDCFGVGYEPIEVSNQGIVDFITWNTKQSEKTQTVLNAHLAAVADGTLQQQMWKTKAIKHNAMYKLFTRSEMEALEPGHFDHVSRETVRDLEFQVKQYGSNVNVMKQKLDVWAPRPLPDAN